MPTATKSASQIYEIISAYIIHKCNILLYKILFCILEISDKKTINVSVTKVKQKKYHTPDQGLNYCLYKNDDVLNKLANIVLKFMMSGCRFSCFGVKLPMNNLFTRKDCDIVLSFKICRKCGRNAT